MKTKKNNLSSIVLVFIFCLQIFSVGFDNPFYNSADNLMTGEEIGPNQDINSALDGLYEEKNFNNKPDVECYKEALNNKLIIYNQIEKIQLIEHFKTHIVTHSAVVEALKNLRA